MVDPKDTHRVDLTKLGLVMPEQRISLVVYHRNGILVAPLDHGRSVVVGRASPSDLMVPDGVLSRQHARFELAQGSVWVQDLGSTNGTWMNETRIERSQVPVGGTVTMGGVTVSVHTVGPSESPFHRLSSHDQFLTILEEEVFRAKSFQRSVAVVVIRAEQEGADPHVSRWYQRIRKLLRPIDRAAVYAPDTIEISLPELSLSDTVALCRSMVSQRTEEEPILHGGVACFPDAGATAEHLIDAALSASHHTEPSELVGVAETRRARWWQEERAGELVIASDAMRSLFETVDRLAGSDVPVLIEGETGTGKELVAQTIHGRGPRRDKRMCCVNCGAIPGPLVESLLFGHVRGAFTGADKSVVGVFEQADGGTVLLDEIGELPLPAQAALLRVLDTKRVARIGSHEERELDVRVLAATNCDLEEMCRTGNFRRDVWYRLNTFVLELPPLRARTEEISELVGLFVEQANRRAQQPVKGIADEVLEVLRAYHWPGNVRELRNVVERAVVIAQHETITVDDLSERVRKSTRSPSTNNRNEPIDDGETMDIGDFKARVQAFETRLIERALVDADWNQTQAARDLGIPLRTLVRKIKAFELEKP